MLSLPGSQLGDSHNSISSSNQVLYDAELPLVSVTVIIFDNYHIPLAQGSGMPLVFQVVLFSEGNKIFTASSLPQCVFAGFQVLGSFV